MMCCYPSGPRGKQHTGCYPRRPNRCVKIDRDRSLYKQRDGIERTVARLKINRTIVTRCEQLAENFMTMVRIATAKG